jgi:hypothetical protein
MKIKLPTIALIALIVAGCSESKMLINNGQYDLASLAAAERLRSNKKNEKEALRLEEAYRIAQDQDFKRIQQLRAEGNPNNLKEIYQIYEKINQRQNVVAPLLPIYLRKSFREIDIKIVDITSELANSKNQSIEFTYQTANRLLDNNLKSDVRKAFNMYSEVERMYPNYKDVVSKKREAASKGIVNVGVVVKNSANVILPKDFEELIRDFSTWGLQYQWVNFDKTYNLNLKYDYTVVLHIRGMDVSPEQFNTREFEETKTIQDGFEYVLDKKGNVMKDSLGNDVKTPKMITLRANIFETRQFKSAIMTGSWEVKNLNSGKTLTDVPFAESVNFENYHGTFRGDKRAISQQSLNRIGGRVMPFPSSFQMINNAAEMAKLKLKSTIQNNVNAFLND